MVEIVTFDPDLHQPAWEAFIVASYSDPNYVALSPEFLRWQFLDNPANDTGGYTLWLALHQGAVVAQLGHVPFMGLTPEGQSFRGAYPINLMALPEYRASGLGVILLSRLLREMPCLVNPGANQAGSALGRGLGMQDLGCLNRHICVTDVAAARSLAAEGRLPAVAERVGQAAGRPPSSAYVMAMGRLPAETPEGFLPPVPACRAERSRDFFRWRYDTHPAFTYEFVLSPDLASVLVFHEERERNTGALIIRIVDLLAREEHQDALLGAVVQAAKERGAAIVDFFCSLGCYDTSLKRAGFFDEAKHQDGRIAALFQPLDFRDASIRVIASNPPGQGPEFPWYITKADSDQDRPNDKNAVGRRAGRASASAVDPT
jgi:GNAT superfamily N-acetyltransferase